MTRPTCHVNDREPPRTLPIGGLNAFLLLVTRRFAVLEAAVLPEKKRELQPEIRVPCGALHRALDEFGSLLSGAVGGGEIEQRLPGLFGKAGREDAVSGSGMPAAL